VKKEQIEVSLPQPIELVDTHVPLTTRAARNGQKKYGKRIHVLYLIDRLYIQGGGEETLIRIVQNLPRNEFQVSVAAFDAHPEAVRRIGQTATALHILPMHRAFDWNGLKTALQLRRLIRSKRIDIVHTFFETANLWGGLVTKSSRGPLLVSSRRDMGILRKRKHWMAYRAVNRVTDAVVAVSDKVRTFSIETERLDAKRVSTIHNGVDLEALEASNGISQLRSRLALKENSLVVSTIANIRRVKSIDTLLRTAAIVRHQFPNVRFLIAGSALDREYFQELQQLVERLDLYENIVFLGHCEEVPALLKLSNVFCLLSRSEGFSNALLEAMACSLPCVATRVGGNPEAIEDGENGFLVPVGNSEAAADHICSLLRNPRYAKEVGLAARHTIERQFTSQKMVHELGSLYHRLLCEKFS
jgi:L-malate glycosyltransferase